MIPTNCKEIDVSLINFEFQLFHLIASIKADENIHKEIFPKPTRAVREFVSFGFIHPSISLYLYMLGRSFELSLRVAKKSWNLSGKLLSGQLLAGT